MRDREIWKKGLRKWATPWRTWVSLGTVGIVASVPWRSRGSLSIPAAVMQGPPVLGGLFKGLSQGVPLLFIPCCSLESHQSDGPGLTPAASHQLCPAGDLTFPPSAQVPPLCSHLTPETWTFQRTQRPRKFNLVPPPDPVRLLTVSTLGRWHPPGATVVTPSTLPAGNSQPVITRVGLREGNF